jgi:hypothetical protein
MGNAGRHEDRAVEKSRESPTLAAMLQWSSRTVCPQCLQRDTGF